jgi:hypothetical protein
MLTTKADAPASTAGSLPTPCTFPNAGWTTTGDPNPTGATSLDPENVSALHSANDPVIASRFDICFQQFEFRSH